MRARLFAAVLAVMSMVTTGMVAAGPAAASAYGITAISLDAGPVTVVGLTGTALAHVSVAITSTPPVQTCTAEPTGLGSGHVSVVLTRVAGGSAESVTTVLDLATGDATAGRWDGTWRVGAGRGGTWQISRVSWCSPDGAGHDGYSVDPRVTPGYTRTMTVVATAAPRVTITRIPRIAAYGARQWITATYATSTGVPLAGRLLTYGTEVDCGLYAYGGSTLRLDAHGRATLRLLPYAQCLFLAEPQSRWVTSSTTVIRADYPTQRHYYAGVTARAASASFPVSLGARVPTSVSPAVGVVSLQVLAGRTWHTVNTRAAASRLNLHVPAGARASWVTGAHLYRVVASLAPGQGAGLAPTRSRTFTMTGV